ncbi:MAG TPA: 3-hydroxyacyl-ACP dehydratase FabZ [Rhodospirillales bacterium]|jgi:3-hydroxyacyl-[acyl-carrier-protein] dehydratase|nr:3-hydroxyacyl-ACP dehydratase FabZ [Rhodospirillales bacterium]
MAENSPSTPGKTLDINRIKEKIPHRYPFLMIDKVIGLVADSHAVGIKNVSINEAFFQGHFPSQPIMPGVLIIEAMAQTSAVLVMETLGKNAEGTIVYFMSVDQARFRKPITPGDTVHVHVEKNQQRGNVWKFKGKAMVDAVLMAEATFAAMIVEE